MRYFACLLLTTLVTPLARAHLFTDDMGRTVEAEIGGVRGDHVILARSGVAGLWPTAKLSAIDQAFVREWRTTHSGIKQLQTRISERDGIGERGLFTSSASSPAPPSLPGVSTDTKQSFKHCVISLANPNICDATALKVDYVLYAIQPDGSVDAEAGSQSLDVLAASKGATLITEGMSLSRTKTTRMTLNVNVSRSSGSVSTGKTTTRARERFGGGWVRVHGADGSLLGEAKSMQPELQKLDPPWVGAKPVNPETIPMLPSLDGLLELVKKLPKLPGASTGKIAPASDQKPPLPPGFPPPPGR
ncbi:MAG: hypothetical protein JNM99_00695 [Verrucomicrobiaceae bacterium]|nr:hypothetical protein [Verrucomicrobiaceae bacterium]